ncbi:MAG: hypothetical protein Q8P61_03290 [Candidatus Nanopelagicales bacterium]|nr:hypothetical protein [Candidatus Nanopelagicales bacterium]
MNAQFAPRIAEAAAYLGLGVAMVFVQAMAPPALHELLTSVVADSADTAHCDTSEGHLSWSIASVDGGVGGDRTGIQTASSTRPGFTINGLGSQCVGKRLSVTLRDRQGTAIDTVYAQVSAKSHGTGHRAVFEHRALGKQSADIHAVQVAVVE